MMTLAEEIEARRRIEQAADRAVAVLREWNPLMHPDWNTDAKAAILKEFGPLLGIPFDNATA